MLPDAPETVVWVNPEDAPETAVPYCTESVVRVPVCGISAPEV